MTTPPTFSPQEIVIISGKGGTGKTSVTASLATLASKSVLADCDVDAADLHLLLEPKVDTTHQFISGHEAIINEDQCISCGLCEEKCRFDAISHVDTTYTVEPISCEGCKVCVALCPVGAIDFPASNCGEWFESTTPYGPMIHARLKAGAENSGKLVSTVRKEAKEQAIATASPFIIVDGPPGIGCPVISSITGANLLLMVTEPTLSGKHDLERVLKLAKHFAIPAAICINKFDLNSDVTKEITLLAKEYNSPVVGKLPYSPFFSKAQTQGKPITKLYPDSQEATLLAEMWETLQTVIPSNKE
jgi:MinD superfamily P-loop ATPase